MNDEMTKDHSQSAKKSVSRINARWTVLGVLTFINILNYVDRNIFSALVPAMKQDLGFSDTKLGLLGSAFILSYTLVSPIFGYFGDGGGRTKIMAGGLVLWSAATAGTGMVRSFASQFATRVTVGFGEAAYSVIAPTVIADHFPRRSRARVFAFYSCAIPVGSALGYVIGGLLEPRIGWSHAFFVVGVPGVVLALLLMLMRDPVRGAADPDLPQIKHQERQNFRAQKKVYRELFRNGGFLSTVLGYSAYTFVVGGLAFWMPSYIVRYFPGVSLEKGNLVFGGVTVVGGFIGTIIGGWWADRIEHRTGNGYLKVSFYSMLVAAPLFVVALSMSDFTRFSIVLFILDIFLFLSTSPLDAAVITFVKPQYRATAMALNIFLIHALGDGVSRVLMAVISDASGLKSAMVFLPFVLLLAGFLWLWGFIAHFRVMLWPEGAIELVKFQAHRGFRPNSSVVENTLAAFRLAKTQGAQMFECDVRLTSDRQVVIFHDGDLKRIGGSNKLVSELTFEDLHRLTDAPLLLDVLNDPQSPQKANIELKSGEAIGRSGLERAVAEVVRQAGAEHRVVFSSFNPLALWRMSKAAPQIPRALLVTEEPDPENKIYLRKMWLAWLARPHLLHIDNAMATPERIEAWRERGIPIAVWTVNDPARARELLASGVTSIISDHVYCD